jgi:ribosomal-protein-alanine N-acetyltransferase
VTGALSIEAAREDELPAVAAMHEPPGRDLESLRAELARPWARLWVAREAGAEIVGFALVWCVADEVHLLDLVARADRRRRGVGRALLEHVLAYGRDHAAATVLLEVRRSNVPALSLYRAAGFSEGRVRPAYYADGEDAVEMALALARPRSAGATPPSSR